MQLLSVLVASLLAGSHAGFSPVSAPRPRTPATSATTARASTPLASARSSTATVREPSFKLPTFGHLALPAIGYTSLGAATYGATTLLPLTWTTGLLIGWCVGMPVLSVMSAAFLGGPGIAKALGGAPTDDPRLEKIASEAAEAVGVKPPLVFEVKSREPNAFAASGFGNGQPTVAVTSGLREVLNEEELSAVLAHEMGHLRHRDVTRNLHIAAAAAGLGGFYELGRTLLDSQRRSSKKSKKDDDESSGAALGLTLMAAGAATEGAAHLIRLAASRSAELKADRAAAEAYGAQTLISALKKIDNHAARRPADLRGRGEAKHFAHAMISDGPSRASAAAAASPRRGGGGSGKGKFGWVDRVLTALRTHPTLETRVEALETAAKNGLVPERRPGSNDYYSMWTSSWL